MTKSYLVIYQTELEVYNFLWFHINDTITRNKIYNTSTYPKYNLSLGHVVRPQNL